MTERSEVTQNPEQRTINIYNKVNRFVDIFGKNVEGNWKKATAVFKDGIDEETLCASVTIHAGNKEGEVKIIYERDEIEGGVKRSEMAFRENGTFSERVYRSNAESLPSFILMSEITDVIDTKLDEVDILLSKTELWLRNHPQEDPCRPQKPSRPPLRIGHRHKRPQRLDKGERRVF
jgi:hypothetical protein